MEEIKELPIDSILSYSRIDLFRQCPYRYKLQYIDKNYTDTTSLSLQLGTLSHFIFEMKYTPNQTMTLEEIWEGFLNGFEEEGIKGFNYLCDEYGFEIYEVDEKTNTSVEDRVKVMKDKFFNEPIDEEWEAIGLEQEFLITFNNKAQIKGFIDRVDRNKVTGELRVLDYKTNKRLYDKKDLSTSLQFYIYALACKELYGQYPVECIYDMLFLNTKQYALTKGWEQRGFKALNKVLDSIIWYKELGEEHMPPKSCPLCYWCPYSKTNPNSKEPYNELCPYYLKWTPDNRTFAKNKEWIPPMSKDDDLDLEDLGW